MKLINYVLLGSRVKEKREEKGLTQEQLSEATSLSSVHISYIESAKRKPSLGALLRICNALDITMDDLLVGNQTPSGNDYQSDFAFILSDSTPLEKRFIYLVLRCVINVLRENDITVEEK